MASILFCFYRMSVLSSLLIILAGFLGYVFLSTLLTCTVLVFSTFFFKSSKKKPNLDEKSVKDETFIKPEDDGQEISSSSSQEEEEEEVMVPEEEPITETRTKQEKKGNDHQVEVDDIGRSSVSESDCLGRSSTSEEDSEMDWVFKDRMFQSPYFSDGSISDEESLIEIALPGGHYVGHKKEEEEDEEEVKKTNLQKKLPADFEMGYSFFKQKQQGIMELLAELNDMNEEENLIEIDISMGSIKCPRFEIKA